MAHANTISPSPEATSGMWRVSDTSRHSMKRRVLMLALLTSLLLANTGIADAAAKPQNGFVVCNPVNQTAGWIDMSVNMVGKAGETGWARFVIDQYLWNSTKGKYQWTMISYTNWIQTSMNSLGQATVSYRGYDSSPTTKDFIKIRMEIWDGYKPIPVQQITYETRYAIGTTSIPNINPWCEV